MTKEEIIKEAWINTIGNENYQSVLKNNEFKENGWRSVSGLPMYAEEVYNIIKYKSNLFSIRPKSLQGIENNNGWIKIESENDLPKEGGDYYVIHEGSINYYPEADKQYFNRWIGVYSHYQLIQKPKQPIY